MNCFGLLKFQIFLGVLEIPDIFGVNGRCWALAYVCRKNESTPALGFQCHEHSAYDCYKITLSFDVAVWE